MCATEGNVRSGHVTSSPQRALHRGRPVRTTPLGRAGIRFGVRGCAFRGGELLGAADVPLDSFQAPRKRQVSQVRKVRRGIDPSRARCACSGINGSSVSERDERQVRRRRRRRLLRQLPVFRHAQLPPHAGERVEKPCNLPERSVQLCRLVPQASAERRVLPSCLRFQAPSDKGGSLRSVQLAAREGSWAAQAVRCNHVLRTADRRRRRLPRLARPRQSVKHHAFQGPRDQLPPPAVRRRSFRLSRDGRRLQAAQHAQAPALQLGVREDGRRRGCRGVCGRETAEEDLGRPISASNGRNMRGIPTASRSASHASVFGDAGAESSGRSVPKTIGDGAARGCAAALFVAAFARFSRRRIAGLTAVPRSVASGPECAATPAPPVLGFFPRCAPSASSSNTGIGFPMAAVAAPAWAGSVWSRRLGPAALRAPEPLLRSLRSSSLRSLPCWRGAESAIEMDGSYTMLSLAGRRPMYT
ncbi:hypothetical protein DFJ74DRAFT_93568 [Hyaloraphidium curvatum]|nr:hypothetical protein DFJ74DRAFT_93568 [Hyaloraphidium curvatum]